MANANPTPFGMEAAAKMKKPLIQQNAVPTLPPGKGNHMMKKDCPKCGTRYGYWVEEGDPGCMNCDITESIARATKNREEKAAVDKEAFDAAVSAEVRKQIAIVMADARPTEPDPANYPQDEQKAKKENHEDPVEEEKPDEKKAEKKMSKGPFSKK